VTDVFGIYKVPNNLTPEIHALRNAFGTLNADFFALPIRPANLLLIRWFAEPEAQAVTRWFRMKNVRVRRLFRFTCAANTNNRLHRQIGLEGG
jgi:hypothetical protein